MSHEKLNIQGLRVKQLTCVIVLPSLFIFLEWRKVSWILLQKKVNAMMFSGIIKMINGRRQNIILSTYWIS